MSPNSESDVDTGTEAESLTEREDDAAREELRRMQMIGRARDRRAYWQRELAAERFEEFRPEMRRRVQVEQTLLDGLENRKLPIVVLMKTYLRDSVPMAGQPKSESEEEKESLLVRIGKATQRRKEMLATLELTPQRLGWERKELLRKIAAEEEYVRGLQAKVRELQS